MNVSDFWFSFAFLATLTTSRLKIRLEMTLMCTIGWPNGFAWASLRPVNASIMIFISDESMTWLIR
jgi:hypothetical protein